MVVINHHIVLLLLSSYMDYLSSGFSLFSLHVHVALQIWQLMVLAVLSDFLQLVS